MKVPETAKKLLDDMISSLDDISQKTAANDLRKLRNDLDTQSTYIFDCKDEFEAKTRFVSVIMQYTHYIDWKRFYSINVQKQLMHALNRAQNIPELEKEAYNVIQFIQEAPRTLWADGEDYDTLVRNFKLIKDENALNKISSKFHEIPTENFKGIRIFYKYDSALRMIKENHFREWKKYRQESYVYGTDPIWVLKWWYGLHDTGTYYIYVPKN